MNKRTFRPIAPLAVAACLLVVGCNRPQQPVTDALPSDPAVPDVSTAAVAPADVVFNVDPPGLEDCQGNTAYEATVTWAVTRPGVSTVRVELDGAGQPLRKTFAAGGATGEARTGAWVTPGLRFHLVDGGSGDELASHEAELRPCASAQAAATAQPTPAETPAD